MKDHWLSFSVWPSIVKNASIHVLLNGYPLMDSQKPFALEFTRHGISINPCGYFKAFAVNIFPVVLVQVTAEENFCHDCAACL